MEVKKVKHDGNFGDVDDANYSRYGDEDEYGNSASEKWSILGGDVIVTIVTEIQLPRNK